MQGIFIQVSLCLNFKECMMKGIILLFFVATASAEIVGYFKEFEVHHYNLEGPSSDTIYDFDRDARIINGSDAQPGQFPFVARLSITRRNPETEVSSGTLCSGSLIHEQFALTASHCVTPNPDWITNVAFLIGTVNRNVAGTIVNSAEFWFLEQPATLVKDLAMFRFAQPIVRTSLIDFIRLPSRVQTNYEFVGWPVTTIGWGRDNTGASTVHLQYAHFLVLSINVCSTRFTEYEICYVDNGTDSMTQPGDSGGPGKNSIRFYLKLLLQYSISLNFVRQLLSEKVII